MSLLAGLTFREPHKVEPYAAALRQAGIEPVLISPGHARPLAGLQGLVLSGGTDINPARYGGVPHPDNEPPDDERDDLEARLLAEALAAEIPVLAICRGMQLFNVAHGGTLIQHLRFRGPPGAGQRSGGAGTQHSGRAGFAPGPHLWRRRPRGEFAAPSGGRPDRGRLARDGPLGSGRRYRSPGTRRSAVCPCGAMASGGSSAIRRNPAEAFRCALAKRCRGLSYCTRGRFCSFSTNPSKMAKTCLR